MAPPNTLKPGGSIKFLTIPVSLFALSLCLCNGLGCARIGRRPARAGPRIRALPASVDIPGRPGRPGECREGRHVKGREMGGRWAEDGREEGGGGATAEMVGGFTVYPFEDVPVPPVS